MLAPYDENIEVEGYKEYISDNSIKGMIKEYGTKDQFQLALKIQDWTGCIGGVDETGLFYWSTYNPKSKWDWWLVGGRWSGKFKLKKSKNGLKGSPGVFKNDVGIDVAYAKDIDQRTMKKFFTCAVLDSKGWHEPAKMGWFASTYDRTEDEETWDNKYRERFLTNLADDTVLAVVDCHI